MNVSRILENLDEHDRTKLCKAIADAGHYVAIALDVLPVLDQSSFSDLCRVLDYLDDLNDEIETHLSDAGNGAGNGAGNDVGDKALQEAYDIIAADDGISIEQLITELMQD